MRRCGQQYPTLADAKAAAARRAEKSTKPGTWQGGACRAGCGQFHVSYLQPRKAPKPRVATVRRPAGSTGFPPAVRLLIRTRAGNGDPDQARCECCGRWLGRTGGQCHHRLGRQAGGSRLRNKPSNGLLACGTPFTGCHGEATAFRPHTKAKGFVLNSGQDPALVPVRLHGGARRVWLDDEGGYLLAAPQGVAA